ncbi:MAG: NigD-like C-terminal domain-containing protein [Prevotella sp.]|nr:NigD-like C-terminal domain-containing protein [Prevotella sp.]
MRRLSLLLLAMALLAACEHSTYDEGDGRYSYLKVDLALAHTVASGQMDYAVTDDGDSLLLSPYATAKWASKADTLYRTLLYYDVSGSQAVKPFSAAQVPVLSVRDRADVDTMFTDAVNFESAWVSRGGQYLNMGLLLKTGVKEGVDARQVIGIVRDSVGYDAQGDAVCYLTLYHRQNGVPEYYSSKVYVSVPLKGNLGARKIHLSVNSYTGKVDRVFQY